MTWQAELEALIEETMAHVKAMEGAKVKPVAPVKIIENAIAEPPRLARLESMTASSVRSEREEIKRRVASFKAVAGRKAWRCCYGDFRAGWAMESAGDYCVRGCGISRGK